MDCNASTEVAGGVQLLILNQNYVQKAQFVKFQWLT